MKVTKIDKQVKNPHRYSIYIDDKYSFSLGESQLATIGLRIGQELTPEELKAHKQQSDLGKLYDRTLKWLAIRPRSEWEIDSYLMRISPKEETFRTEITARLQKLDLVDDLAFARSWVESRRMLKSTSRRKLWQELTAKRVPRDIVEEVLAEDETDEIEVLKSLIVRKRRQSQYADPQKLLSFLARQGFPYGQIRAALDELDLVVDDLPSE